MIELFSLGLLKIRALLGALILMPMITVTLSVVTLLIVIIGRPKSWVDCVIRVWARLICWIFRVEVKVKNPERWPAHDSAVILFNHSSYFDIFSIHSVFPEARFAAKEELFKIPIFGAVMQRVGTIPIARKDPQRAIEVMNSFVPKMGARQIAAFAPEGTRSDGLKILPFKSGPFIFAIKAQAMILPIFIRGAHEVWPAGRWVPRVRKQPWQIVLELGEPIITKGLSESDRSKLSETVKASFETSLSSES